MSSAASKDEESPTDPRTRFRGLAAGYARFRPGYPDALVDWVVSEAGLRAADRVADVGCGTGILGRMLARRELDVVGVDPNEDMLAEARAAGGGADYRRGDAEATGLPESSVVLVTAAQAFHWFQRDACLAEFRRVLVPDGHVAALWNIRGEGAFMAAYDALLRRFSSEYRLLDSWETTLGQLKGDPRLVSRRERWVSHAQYFDLEGLRGRAWSSSYVRRGVEDRAGFEAALQGLFDSHARDGAVEFAYRSVALVFRIRPDQE
jgi:SAM-dependent methyltransferase